MNREERLFLKLLIGTSEENVTEYNIGAVLKLASEHSMLPLMYENLVAMSGFDKDKYPVLQRRVFSIVFSQAKRTANFKKIYNILLDNGIKPVVLKGVICRQLYGELCDHRPSGDEDILVKKEDYFKIQDILFENGYTTDETVNKKSLAGIQEVTFKNPNGLNIEVHLNIIGTENKFRRKMNKYFDNIFDKTIVMEIDCQEYYTLDYTENYIYLFYHLFKHFSMTGVGIRQVLDLFKFAETYRDKIDWDKVYEATKSINAHKLYGDIVEIINKYWGGNLDNPFGALHPERLLEDMFSAGAYGNNTAEQIGSKVKVMATLDTGGKWGTIRSIFPTVESMREYYKVLYNHPYLLPIMWIVRIVRYIFRSSTGRTYNVSKSESIADKKIQLLKDYHII